MAKQRLTNHSLNAISVQLLWTLEEECVGYWDERLRRVPFLDTICVNELALHKASRSESGAPSQFHYSILSADFIRGIWNSVT